MYKKLGAMILVLLFGLTGCSSKVDDSAQPIDSSIDICESCNMSIINERFAGEVITKEGQALKFDDIGCLASYIIKHDQGQESNEGAIYVKDYNTLEWIPAQEASYVRGSIDTPMSSGLVAFDSEEAAQTFGQKNQDIMLMDWQKVLSSKQAMLMK